MQATIFSPEFDLIRRCCSHIFAQAGAGPFPEFGRIDWQLFLALVKRHRVEGLVYLSLGKREQVPDAVLSQLEHEGRKVVADNLQAMHESRRLAEAFATAGLPLLFIKGLALSRLAYGDPFIKRSIDIDLLVPADRIADAARLLGDLDYRPLPPTTTERIKHWHRRSKESGWRHPRSFQVDLHSRLTDRPDRDFPFDPWKSSRSFEVTRGCVLMTLGEAPLLAYLAVHGGTSGWFRLKWLADFAGLLAKTGNRQLQSCWNGAVGTGVETDLALALLLSREFFGTSLPNGVKSTAERSRRLSWLLRLSRYNLLMIDEPTENRLGTSGIHAMQLMLPDDWQKRWFEAVRQVRHALLVRGMA